MAKSISKPTVQHRCRECANVSIVTRFHTLNINGDPTLGECPYWTASRCVLLSQRACVEHFRMKE